MVIGIATAALSKGDHILQGNLSFGEGLWCGVWASSFIHANHVIII